MEIYGYTKSHIEQKKERKVSSLIVLAVFIGIGLLLSYYFENYKLIIVIILSFFYIFLVAEIFKDQKKISNEIILDLMSKGQKNKVFINTLNQMLEDNGYINDADLKGLYNKFSLKNEEYKQYYLARVKHEHYTNDHINTWESLKYNDEILKQIKSIVNCKF